MNGNASKYTTPIDKSSDNISFINYLKNFFPVFNEFSFTDNYLVFENNKLSLQGFDIKEIFYDSSNSFYKHLREDLLSAKKIFRIFRVYENKNMYFEYENKFYENFGSDADFVDRYNEYFYNLMLFFEYLTEELKRFLGTFVNRIMIIQSDINYTDNIRLAKEVDFYNDALLKLNDASLDNNSNNKHKSLVKVLTNGYQNNETGTEYDPSIEELRPLSRAGYLNIFVNILLILSIGIVFGSIIFISAIS